MRQHQCLLKNSICHCMITTWFFYLHTVNVLQDEDTPSLIGNAVTTMTTDDVVMDDDCS